jgi:hypothetical protein
MPLPSSQEIQGILEELCSEDDWGSWELWWNIAAEVSPNEIPVLKSQFLDVVGNMVATGKLIAKRQNADGQCIPTSYDQEKLSHEIDSERDPDPDSFFWFRSE